MGGEDTSAIYLHTIVRLYQSELDREPKYSKEIFLVFLLCMEYALPEFLEEVSKWRPCEKWEMSEELMEYIGLFEIV